MSTTGSVAVAAPMLTVPPKTCPDHDSGRPKAARMRSAILAVVSMLPATMAPTPRRRADP